MIPEWLKRWWNHCEYGTPAAEILGERVTPFLQSIPAPHQVRSALDAYTENVVIVLNVMSDLLGNAEQVRAFTLSSGCIRLPACRYLTDEEVEQTKKALTKAGWIVKEVVFVQESRRHLYYLEFPPRVGGCTD
ncbi:hypothetical protein [Pseudomonas phage D6]|nr:hypothetical protein [Pseudomonas phage D6]